ncbi:hypothetical protein LAZ67_12002385 [Cordylochernes scorpioides]|uniref:Ankyrin repeat domain-containing protein n=1 Tax=Cordylochernes scorpioides TaxID=51811 RepID=A0ABY6L1R5_9ARAC|nr:hypothetical protein LAZ67_12002385 [Cordylochernes scorpioides]
MLDILGDLNTFEGASPAQVSNIQKARKSSLSRLKITNQITSAQFQSYTSNLSNTPYIYGLPKKGADIHSKDFYGNSSLFRVAMNGNLDRFNYLIDAGVDANYVNRCGKSALFYAAHSDSPQILEYFLKSGFDVNVADKYGATALMNAYSRRKLSNVRMLLNAGANINVRDNSGLTPLANAIKNPT